MTTTSVVPDGQGGGHGFAGDIDRRGHPPPDGERGKVVLCGTEKEYEIADPDVAVRLQEDGSLIVRESLPFDFTGDFTGAYRDVPLVGGARITPVAGSFHSTLLMRRAASSVRQRSFRCPAA